MVCTEPPEVLVLFIKRDASQRERATRGMRPACITLPGVWHVANLLPVGRWSWKHESPKDFRGIVYSSGCFTGPVPCSKKLLSQSKCRFRFQYSFCKMQQMQHESSILERRGLITDWYYM